MLFLSALVVLEPLYGESFVIVVGVISLELLEASFTACLPVLDCFLPRDDVRPGTLFNLFMVILLITSVLIPNGF